MKWAYIVNLQLVQFVDNVPENGSPYDYFPAVIADACELVPDDIVISAFKVDGVWVNPVIPPVEPPAPTESEWVQKIADKRYALEIAGVQWGDFKLATDRESQGKIVMESTAVSKSLRTENEGWKCYDTVNAHSVFRPTTNAEIDTIFQVVFEYIRTCFRREGALLAKVAAGIMTQPDLDTGWPN